MQIVVNVSREALVAALHQMDAGGNKVAPVVAETVGAPKANEVQIAVEPAKKRGRPPKAKEPEVVEDDIDEEGSDEAADDDYEEDEEEAEAELVDEADVKKLKAALGKFSAHHGADGKKKAVAVLMKVGGSKALSKIPKATLPKLLNALKVA